MKTEKAKALPAFPCAAQLAPGHRAANAGLPQRRQLAGASTTGQDTGSPAGTPPESPGQAQLAAAPVVNIYLTGCNINNGRNQIVGNHNTLIGQNAYGPADLSQWQAETIRAQAATIAAQQRTIDRLITILEGRAAGA